LKALAATERGPEPAEMVVSTTSTRAGLGLFALLIQLIEARSLVFMPYYLELENLVEILNRFRGKKEEKKKWDGSDAFTFFPELN
jgi:hypothetical protein